MSLPPFTLVDVQAMVEKTYNSLVNISLNMHGARAVQAKHQGSGRVTHGTIIYVIFGGQHIALCGGGMILEAEKTRIRKEAG